MIMTAQYRPYRDEDCVDSAETEHIGWPDHEPGIQIYEKTTESMDIPFTRRKRSMLLLSLLLVFVGSLCFLFGFFSHTSHSECVVHTSTSLDAVRDEDPTIRAKLLSSIDANRIRQWVREFSAKPHIAGSEEDLRLAVKILDFFKAHNFEQPTLKNYTVLLSLPNEQKPNFVSIVDGSTGRDVYSTFNSSRQYNSFSPFSPKGNVTGDIMFINYGRPVDYLQLQALFNSSENIFKGKILLAKQFHISASEQYKYAMAMNASALLLYPDPQHYNPKNEKPYPDSIWLPSNGIRGDSIFWNGAGDPQTFGLPSNAHAFKDSMEFSDQISIPAQPISIETAYEIMRRLNDSRDAPLDWKGGFNLTYKVGPGLKDNLKVHVSVNNELAYRTIHNVMGTIRGRVEPDRYIIVGNQRDSASHGAVDSATGTATFLELARVFSTLVREGWKPRRSIIFCSWGAEEFNLLGSTEWVEEMNKILYMRAVAYININMLVTGNDTLSVAASPLLYHTIFNASKEVFLPESELDNKPESFNSVYDKWLTSHPVMRNVSTFIFNITTIDHRLEKLGVHEHVERQPHQFHREEASEPGSILKTYLESAFQEIRPHIKPLDMYGSYAPFIAMAGIPAIDLSFVRQNFEERATENDEFEKIAFNHLPYPLLHTQYDHSNAVEKFIDPEYKYHKMASQILAEVARDLCDSLFLPFNIFDYAQLLKDFYFKSVHMHNAIIGEYKNTENGDNAHLDLMQGLDMGSLESAINNFTNEAIRFHARQDKIDFRDPMAIRRINDQLLTLERQFLDHRGIPSNNLKRHLILSPAETLSSINALETDGLFPALLDELDQIIGNVYKKDIHHSMIRLQKHLPILINSVQSAADLLADI